MSWNQQVQTDRTIPNDKPDIIICDNENGTCMLIDVAISEVRNVIKKEADNILKYTDLTIEMQHMWNVKTIVIPIGTSGIFLESFRKYLSNVPGKHKIKTTERIHIGHGTHTSECTNVKVKNLLTWEIALDAP
jgi:hypothetical protein